MSINFRITAIENKYNYLFDLNEDELLSKGAVIMTVDEKPGFPCRITLEDAEVGEEVVLFPFQHHKTNSPYQSSGPIFMRKNAKKVNLGINEIPEMLFKRLQSLRVYDKNGMMIDAKILDGKAMKKEIGAIFSNDLAQYIQVHNANPGCYNCQINRV